MRIISVCIILFFSKNIFAQSGGLNISYITFYYTGDTINNDKNLKIIHYVVDDNFKKIKFQFEGNQTSKFDYQTGANKLLYLPPTYADERVKTCKNQRLEIIYKQDTMTIDFVTVMQENQSGEIEQMDKIEFFPGKFKMYLRESERYDSCLQFTNQFPDQIEKLKKDMEVGITQNHTTSYLRGWHILEQDFNPDINLIWARYIREYATEIEIEHAGIKVTQLCPAMITLTTSHMYINTKQKKQVINDTTTLVYMYYLKFAPVQFPREIITTIPKMEDLNSAESEFKIAQTYLDVLVKNTLYVNGTRYSGKIIVFVKNYLHDVFPHLGLDETHYYFAEGKLQYHYKPIRVTYGY